MSTIFFETKLFVSIHRQNEQTRNLYSIVGEEISSVQHLIRDGSVFNKELHEEQQRDAGFDNQHPGKAYKYLIDGSSLTSGSFSNNAVIFDSIRDKSIALCVNFGISSSLWMLGKPGYGLSVNTERDMSCVESILQEFTVRLYEKLRWPTEGETNYTRNQYIVNIKCYEVFGDQIRDLVALSNPTESSIAVNVSNKASAPRVREHPVSGAFVAGLFQRTCTTEAEARHTLLQAYDQRLLLLCADRADQTHSVKGPTSTPVSHRVLGAVGHVVIILEVQQELSFTTDSSTDLVNRSAAVQFNILSEIEPLNFKPSKTETIATVSQSEIRRSFAAVEGAEMTVLLSSDLTTSVQVSQLAVCAKSVASLSRVVTIIQQNVEASTSSNINNITESTKTQQHIPYRESTLTRVLQPMLEGKYVNYVHCMLDERAELAGATLATAAYALRLSSEMKAGVRSRVVPNEQLISRVVAAADLQTDGDRSREPEEERVAGGASASRESVSETAEIARETSQQASSLALEGVVRVMGPSVDTAQLDQAETSNILTEEGKNTAFWDLLHSMRAEGSTDYFDLERLQQERTRLLNSLDGIIVRVDTSVASRVLTGGIVGREDENVEIDALARFHTQEDILGFELETQEDGNLHPVISPSKLYPHGTPPRPTTDSSTAVTASPARTPEITTTVRNVKDVGFASSPRSPLNPLQPRPGSTSSLPRSGKSQGLSPLSPLSPPLSSSPSDDTSDVPSVNANGVTPPLRPVHPKSSARNGATSGSMVSSAKNRSSSMLTAPDNLTDLQARTARSQSVKGPRVATTLSPVQAPPVRSSKGRAVAAGAIASGATVRTGSVGTSDGASSKSNSTFSFISVLNSVTSGSSTVKANTSTRSAKAAMESAKSFTPPTTASPLLAPVRAGKVTVKANGLKSFDQTALDGLLSDAQISDAAVVSAQDNFAGAVSSSPRAASINANGTNGTKSIKMIAVPEALAPLRRRGASPNTANLARQGGGFSVTSRSTGAHPSQGSVSATATRMLRASSPAALRVAERIPTIIETDNVADSASIDRIGSTIVADPVSSTALLTNPPNEVPEDEPLQAVTPNQNHAVVALTDAIKGGTIAPVLSTTADTNSTLPSRLPGGTFPALVPSHSLLQVPGQSARESTTSPSTELRHASTRPQKSSERFSSPESKLIPEIVSPNHFGARLEPVLSRTLKTRSSLPSERQELSAAHEDAQGSHLSELETQYLRAVSHTVPQEVAACIRMGVDVKVKNSFGRDAMQIAARNGATVILTLVHEHGGEISSRGPKGDTLYHLAASNGHVGVFEWLSEHVFRGAGLAGDTVDMYGQTPAHVAARRGEVEVLKYLHHTLGVDVLQEDFDGRTPLEVIPKLFLGGNAEGLVQAREFLTSLIELK